MLLFIDQCNLDFKNANEHFKYKFQIVTSWDRHSQELKGCSFRTRLLGRDHHDLQCVKSPHTGRYIFQRVILEDIIMKNIFLRNI